LLTTAESLFFSKYYPPFLFLIKSNCSTASVVAVFSFHVPVTLVE